MTRQAPFPLPLRLNLVPRSRPLISSPISLRNLKHPTFLFLYAPESLSCVRLFPSDSTNKKISILHLLPIVGTRGSGHPAHRHPSALYWSLHTSADFDTVARPVWIAEQKPTLFAVSSTETSRECAAAVERFTFKSEPPINEATTWCMLLAGSLLLQVSTTCGARRHRLAGSGTPSARSDYASGASGLLSMISCAAKQGVN